jgi:hypothetical protein
VGTVHAGGVWVVTVVVTVVAGVVVVVTGAAPTVSGALAELLLATGS